MVSRIPASDDGPATRPVRTTGVAALLIVLAVTVGIWLVNGPEPSTDDSALDQTPTSAPISPAASEPTSSPEGERSSTPPTTDSSSPDEATSDPPSSAAPSIDPSSGLRTVYLLDLPPEAGQTVQAIDRGPPYPYAKDGSTFGNYEGLLPDDERGYYQEFTVETPGSYDRGARRIIEGADGELYWTADHYGSFSLIVQ